MPIETTMEKYQSDVTCLAHAFGKNGYLNTFQASFGPAYAAFDGDYQPGDVVEGARLCDSKTDELIGELRCRVLRRVSAAEVARLAKPLARPGTVVRLSPAQWYEIHAD